MFTFNIFNIILIICDWPYPLDADNLTGET